MFESAMQRHKLDKATYDKELPELRTLLLDAQLELVERRSYPVIIVVTGQDFAGKGQVIQRLYEWLDPRHVRSNAYDKPTEDERLRPRMWRYWRDLPEKGDIGIVFGSWYNDPLIRALRGELDEAGLASELAAINRFEEMLANEGALILKMLLVVSPGEQKRRLAESKRRNSVRHVLDEWGKLRRSAETRVVAGRLIQQTSTAHAPWIVIPSDDPEYRDLTFGRTIAQTMRRRLDAPVALAPVPAPALIPNLDGKTVLDALDLGRHLEAEDYKRKLAKWQSRLAELTDRKSFRSMALAAVFEGTDAAGKGGAIRRVTAALDPRRFRVHPIAAPNDNEKAQPYLWRFWNRVPRLGHVAIFDRSWYGRVLVERVEGYATEAEWLRAYSEINEFEDQLTRDGVLVVKFWLTTSKAEQLRRFEARKDAAFKRHKITDDDWRNRDKWDLYAQAVGDMVDRTSTSRAPWTLVEAEDKRWARVKVLKTLCKAVAAKLD